MKRGHHSCKLQHPDVAPNRCNVWLPDETLQQAWDLQKWGFSKNRSQTIQKAVERWHAAVKAAIDEKEAKREARRKATQEKHDDQQPETEIR